jgi:hypothetical protein
MLTISSCPRCQKPVSIPAGVDTAALVRCPLCAAEYPLGEALPPELIPVLVAADQAAAAEGTAEPEAAIDHETLAEPTAEEAEEKSPLGQEAAIEHEENEAAAVAMGQSPVAALTAVRGRQPRPVSGLKRAIGVVTGGLAGCLAAYYGLAAWFGPEFKRLGFPELPLPFVARLIAGPTSADADGGKSAAEPSAPARPAQSAAVLAPPDAGKTPADTATTPEAAAKPSGKSAQTP